MSFYRRHYPRASSPQVSFEVPSDQGTVRVPVRDLSAGGARVTVDSTVPVGAELDVKLSSQGLGQPEVLRLRARVLRIQRVDAEVDLALEFVDRVESAAIRMQGLVESLRREPGRIVGERPPLVAGDPGGGSGDEPRWIAGGGLVAAAGAPATPDASSAPGAASPASRGESLRRELLRLEDELLEQVERADRAEASLQVVREELAEERERRLAAERTLVSLQAELSKVRAERGELERLRRVVEAAGAVAPERGELAAAEAEVASPSRGPAPAAGSLASRPLSFELAGAAAAGNEPLLGPAEVTSRVVFARHLREGARLRPTARFARFEPVSLLDIRVHDYAKRSDELAGIRKLAQRRVSEEDLLRVLFTFFERGLLRIEPAGERHTPAGSGIVP